MTPDTRPTPARLARLHLRTGAYSLARAELETLAGRDGLDEEALIDLAEVRWRTGDLAGAGDAARAYLETGHESSVALVIAAEAADALGRAAEAHRLVARALEHPDRPLDDVFGGLPRSTIWPGEAHRMVQGPLFGAAGAAGAAGRGGPAGAARAGQGSADPAVRDFDEPFPATTSDEDAVVAAAVSAWTGAGLRGLWDEDRPSDGDESGPATGAATPALALPSGRESLEAGRAALADGRLDEAVTRLALAIRLQAELAPLVLDAIADRTGPAVDLLRGDALRLAGSEGRARTAWAEALRAVAVTDGAPEPHHMRPDESTTATGEPGPAGDPEETT